jgi:hypothetical protein
LHVEFELEMELDFEMGFEMVVGVSKKKMEGIRFFVY